MVLSRNLVSKRLECSFNLRKLTLKRLWISMMRTLMAVTILVCLFGSSAEARSRHHHHHLHLHHYYRHHHHHYYRHHHYHRYHHHADGQYYHYAGRPRAWCGWYMRSQVGSDRDRHIILQDRGLTTDQMLVARLSARSSSGVTTSARSSGTRTTPRSWGHSEGCDAHASCNPFALGCSWLPFCWLASVDVPSLEGRPIRRALAVQPRANSAAEMPNDTYY